MDEVFIFKPHFCHLKVKKMKHALLEIGLQSSYTAVPQGTNKKSTVLTVIKSHHYEISEQFKSGLLMLVQNSVWFNSCTVMEGSSWTSAYKAKISSLVRPLLKYSSMCSWFINKGKNTVTMSYILNGTISGSHLQTRQHVYNSSQLEEMRNSQPYDFVSQNYDIES